MLDDAKRTTAKYTQVAVQDLFLAVRSGECFGLLGQNGAGKVRACHALACAFCSDCCAHSNCLVAQTTTINMLTGVYPPTAGDAFVGGYNIASYVAHPMQVASCVGRWSLTHMCVHHCTVRLVEKWRACICPWECAHST